MRCSVSINTGSFVWNYSYNLDNSLSRVEKMRRRFVIQRAYNAAVRTYTEIRSAIDSCETEIEIDMASVRDKYSLVGGITGDDESYYVRFLEETFIKSGFNVIHCGFPMRIKDKIVKVDENTILLKLKKSS